MPSFHEFSRRVGSVLAQAVWSGEGGAGEDSAAHAAEGPALRVDGPPPGGNTGGKLTVEPKITLRCHWLNTVQPFDQLAAVAALVDVLFGEGEDRDYGLHSYQRSRHWLGGGMLCWTEGRAECWLSLPGGALDALTPDQVLNLFHQLHALGAKGRRVDVAADDHARSVSLADIHAAADAGDFVGFQIDKPQIERKRGVLVGDGHDFGKRGKDGSGCFFQVYDKGLESKGAIDAVRFEARFFKEKAEGAFNVLAACPDVGWFARAAGNLVGGAIDFRHRGDETHVGRMARVDWWERIIAAIGEATVAVGRVVSTLERWCGYARNAVLPSLTLLLTVADSVGVDGWDLLRRAQAQAAEGIDWRRAGAKLRGVEWERCVNNLLGEAQCAT